MNRDLTAWIPGIVAGFLIAVVLGQTAVAFEKSGRWSWKKAPKFAVNPADPYARLERLLSAPDQAPSLDGLRDPFEYGRGPDTRPAPTGGGRTPPIGPAPSVVSRPVLTAIVSDPNDARAILVYENRNYSVRTGDLFADYRVVSISADGVILENGRGERLTLQRPTKGR